MIQTAWTDFKKTMNEYTEDNKGNVSERQEENRKAKKGMM